MTTTPNETPTPRTDALLKKHRDAGWVLTPDIMLCELTRQLERELAEAKAAVDAENKETHLQIDAKMRLAKDVERLEAAVDLAIRGAASDHKRINTLEGMLLGAQAERDAARAEATKWRECADKLYAAVYRLGGRFCSNPACEETTCRAVMAYDALCQQPAPSSPPSPEPSSSALQVLCCTCLKAASTTLLWHNGQPYCSIECLEKSPRAYGSQPTATAPIAAESQTASQLQALQSALDILLRRTEFLLGLFSELRDSRFWLSKTVWPADLALNESTSTSPATQKPNNLGGGSSK